MWGQHHIQGLWQGLRGTGSINMSDIHREVSFERSWLTLTRTVTDSITMPVAPFWAKQPSPAVFALNKFQSDSNITSLLTYNTLF